MIVDEKMKPKLKSMDQEIVNKILSYKEKYSPAELNSIINFMENPLSKIIVRKILEMKNKNLL